MADQMEGTARFARNALLSIGAALGVGSFASAVRGASEAADAAAKMGDRFGIATEKLIGMQHAGDLAGASNEAIAKGLKTTASLAVEAARGSTDAAFAFNQLGLRASEFIQLPMDQQMLTLIDKLGKVENATLRNELANKVWGKSSGELMGLVAEGSQAFEQAARDADAWGLAVNRVDAAKLEMANDAITRAQAAAKGFFTTVALQLAPAIQALADGWADSAAEAKGFRGEAGRAAEIVITGVAYAANFVQGLRFAYVAVKLAVAEVFDVSVKWFAWVIDHAGKFGAKLQFIPGPLGVIGMALKALGTVGSKEMHLLGESTTSTINEIKAELDALAEQGLPADKILASFRRAQALMDEQAKEIARRRQAMMGGASEEITPDKEATASREVWREQLAGKLERIREGNMLEVELEREKLREKNVVLDKAVQAGLITEEQAMEQSALLRQNHAQRVLQIERQQHESKRAMEMGTWQLAAGLLQQFAGQSKAAAIAAIAINKGLAIAQVVINTQAAIARGYAELGPYAGTANAARMYALMGMQIGIIAATGLVEAANVGSGGAAMGTPANPVVTTGQSVQTPQPAEPARPTQTTIIQLPPGFDMQAHAGPTVREWLQEIEEATRDGGRVVIA